MGLVGRKVGPYKVLAQIGSGGMAVVYKAEQSSLGRMVALKELRAELASDEALATRFEREALSIAALGHQNIVHVYDYLERAGNMYIVMEYVEGIDVFTLLQRTDRLPADIAAIIALQAARALEYAHYRGVIHRDFKPANLMVTKQGDVKLMDFGIARDESMEDLTLPGQAIGTPAYMSPEQILGERIDFRSDFFSFGIVLYQMLTGRKPFIEDETIGVMNQIINRGYRRPRSLYPDIPWGMQRIIKRCLQKKPEHRYASTEKLRANLERVVSSRVRLNVSGRLLIYLRHRELVTDNEARTYVRPEELASSSTLDVDSGQVDRWRAVLRPSLQLNALLAVMLALIVMGFERWHPELQRGYLAFANVGTSQLWVDGARVDLVPDEPVTVPPGRHFVELRTASGRRAVLKREVNVEPWETILVDPLTPPEPTVPDGPTTKR